MNKASRKEHTTGAATCSAQRPTGLRGRAGAPVRAGIAVAVLVLLAVGAGVGCGGGRDDGAERLIDESAVRTAGVRTFSFSLEILSAPISGSGLPLTSAQGVVEVPDRIKAVVGGNYATIAHTARVIAIGDDVWRREPMAGRWSWVEPNTTPLEHLDPAAGVISVIAGVRDARMAGAGRVDGVAVQKLTARASAEDVSRLVGAAAAEEEVSVTLWIGEHDKLLRRVDVLGRVGRGEDHDAARTVRLSRFDEPVSIAAPLPATGTVIERGDA